MNYTGSIGFFSEVEAPVLVSVWVLTYGAFISVVAVCGNFLNRRLHDLVTESALERRRQTDMLERFLLHHQAEDEDENEECEEQEE